MSIRLHNIHKSFGSFKAINNVTLEVPDGQLVALLGPSGSGKTTLLRVIAGLEQADAGGQVYFEGKDVAGRHVRERQVGFVFQHYALFKHMSVFENVAFGLRVKPRHARPDEKTIRSKVMELLKLVQLAGFEGRYPSQLSGGQRQRVALARALAVQPKVLLLDEPFGALDAKVRQELRRWLRRLHDEIHVTSLFVTHDQEEALEVADRIVVMNRGRIEQEGTPDEVFHKPANEFVLSFLGNVNLFHGRVEEDGQAVIEHPLEALMQEAAPAEGNGGKAKLFVRPFDLEVFLEKPAGAALAAKVVRIQSAGPVVKAELESGQGQTFHAEIPHDRFRTMSITVGAQVFVKPRDARVFVEDYAI